MTSIPWLHWDLTHFPGYDQSLSRLYLTVLNFELWTLALYSLVFATTVFSCHPFGCAHPFPLLIAELLQFILQVINQILCAFHDFFFLQLLKHIWVIAFSLCIIILFSYLAPFSFSHPSSFLTCCLILYMPVKNMNDFILVFLSLHILCSALNQRNTNPFVVYRHLKNRIHIKVL